MERFDTRVFLIAASVLVAGCGGGGQTAQSTVPPPAAPANPAAPTGSGNGNGPNDMLASSAEAAAKDGYEAGLEYGQALAEAKDKGEDPPERPDNPFLEDGKTLSDSEIDSACRKVGDEVEPTEEATDLDADLDADDPDADDPDADDPDADDPDADDPDAEEPDAESAEATDPETDPADTEDKGYNVDAAGQGDDAEADDPATDDDADTADDDADADPADEDADDADDADDPDDADADADTAEDDADADTAEDDEDGVDLDPETKRRLAAVWECAFEQGTEAGEVIYEESALGDAENDDGGIGLEDSGETDETEEDDGDDVDDDDTTAEAANCGDGSEYAPLSKLKVERVDGAIRVEVEGTTMTGGYTEAKLQTTTEELDDEGVLHLVFCITPPGDDDVVTQATVKHTAILMWARDHEDVTRVIVEGKNTSKQKSVEALEESDEGESDEDE